MSDNSTTRPEAWNFYLERPVPRAATGNGPSNDLCRAIQAARAAFLREGLPIPQGMTFAAEDWPAVRSAIAPVQITQPQADGSFAAHGIRINYDRTEESK